MLLKSLIIVTKSKFEVATFKLNVTKYIPQKANYVVVIVYIVDLVTFIIPFNNIIKNYTKTFRDIGSSDISHK